MHSANYLDIQIGQYVKTTQGKGHVIRKIEGKAGWSWPRYFEVQLNKDSVPHVFARNEVQPIGRLLER